jgi:hypothetical protein
MNMANKEITDSVAIKYIMERLKEGEKAFLDGTANPHHGGTLEHALFAYGWVKEDLRQALMKANPSYRAGQQAVENHRKG